MNRKNLIRLVLAAVVLAGLAWFLHRGERASWQDRPLEVGEAFFENLPVNDVALITMEDADGRVTLRRDESGWSVVERDGYPSNFDTISELLLLMTRLQARQALPVAAGDLGQLALQMPGAEDGAPEESGTLLQLADEKGQPLAALVLGKLHYTTPAGQRAELAGTATGRYVLDPARPGAAYLVTATFENVQPSPPVWIDRRYVNPGMTRRVAVEADGEDRRWVLQREEPGGAWNLDGLRANQTLDVPRVMNVDTMLGALTVADVTDGPEDARVKPLEEKPVEVTVETFDDLVYRFTFGAGDGDNLPVRVTVEDLRAGAEVEEAAGEPGEVEEVAEVSQEREEKLAEAEKFRDRVVFLPRNFLEPFLATRSSLIGPPPTATPEE